MIKIDYDKSKYQLWFHGGPVLFDYPDVYHSNGYLDFGNGFYLGSKYGSAKDRAIGKYKTRDGFVYYFLVNRESLNRKDLNIHKFRGTSENWLDFIIACRESKKTIHNYDIVIGPTADASVQNEIDKYKDGEYGKYGSSEAKQKLIKILYNKNFPIQMCICTEKGISILEDMRVEAVYRR